MANCRTYDAEQTRAESVAHCNRQFARLSAEERVAWSLQHLPGEHVLSSSFGAQSAVMLHLVSRQFPGVPVVLIDTGYLFPETYRFIDNLSARLRLNLQVFRAHHSAAWQEARDGERWSQGRKALADYLEENKLEPMRRALRELQATTWFAGLRRAQSGSREGRAFVDRAGERFKVHPIADWSDRDVYNYLRLHRLPYHPLWEKGFISIGDHHSTRSLHDVDDPSELRFAGMQRECGLHEIDLSSI